MMVLSLIGGWLALIVLLVWAWQIFVPRENERVRTAEERWLEAELGWRHSADPPRIQ